MTVSVNDVWSGLVWCSLDGHYCNACLARPTLGLNRFPSAYLGICESEITCKNTIQEKHNFSLAPFSVQAS